MSESRTQFRRRAKSSSAVVRLARRAAADSAVWATIAPIGRWLRRSRQRFEAGLRSGSSDEEAILSAQRLDTLGDDSRVVASLWALVSAPTVAWRDSGARNFAQPFIYLDLPSKIRAMGVVLAVAVLTHIVALSVLGVPVQMLGWSVRVGLFAASILIVGRPNSLAAAWRDRTAQASMKERA